MEEIKVTENLRQTKLKAEELKLFKQSFVIVPYQVSGFLDYTNRGVTWSPVNPNDFETFKRVWTGNEACSIMWKGSFKLVQDSDTKEMKEQFSLGEVFLGLMETNSFDNVLEKDKSFSEYISQEQISSIKFRVDKQFNITDYYNFMLYKIPELSGSTIYRIESIEKDFIGLELVGYVISFISLNQELANTGRARQQNISPNSPGQGYLECIVEDEEWPLRLGEETFKKLVEGKDYYKLYNRYITGDFSKTKPNPVKKVVVKLLGNGILSSFSMTGRSVNPNIPLTDNFGAQKLLFPINFANASTPTLMRTQNNSQNFYFGEFVPTLDYVKEWKEYIKDFMSTKNSFKYEGFLLFDYDKLKATNLIKNGSYENNLYGYWDENASKVKPWEFEQQRKTIDTSTVLGCESTYEIGGRKKLHDHMFDNYWTQKQLTTLPQNVYETIGFGSLFPIAISNVIGGVVAGATIAPPFALLGFASGAILSIIGAVGIATQNQAKKAGAIPFRGIVSAPFIDYNKDLFGLDTSNPFGNKIPFNSLENSNVDSPNQAFFKGNTINISFEAEITDSFFDTRIQKIMNTENIGQKKYRNGDYIFDSRVEYELNGSSSLIETDSYGFIIDTFQVQAIFNGEISVEFLDNDNNITWSGIYQSEAKWSDSMREIWTEKNCSTFGLENMYFSEPIPYPERLPDKRPTPPGTIILDKYKVVELTYKWEGVDKGNFLNNYAPKTRFLNEIYSEKWPGGIVSAGTFRMFDGSIYKKLFILTNYDDLNSPYRNFEDFKKAHHYIKIKMFENNVFENVSLANPKLSNAIIGGKIPIINVPEYEIFDELIVDFKNAIPYVEYEFQIPNKDFEKQLEVIYGLGNLSTATKRFYCPFEKITYIFEEITDRDGTRLSLQLRFHTKNQIVEQVTWNGGKLNVFQKPLITYFKNELHGSWFPKEMDLFYVGDGKSDDKPFKIEKNIQCLVRITK